MESSKPLSSLQNEIRNCRLCEDDFNFEPKPIIFGHSGSKIMHISQAPSKTVHETGLPFNDLSGKKLLEQWYKISRNDFYNPDNFYIVSTAHCYPGRHPKGGDNPPPKLCAKQWLEKILPLVNNKFYLLVGSMAAKFMFPKQNFTDLVFTDNYYKGKLAYVLPHPSPRNINWFRDHPDFYDYRIKQIQEAIHHELNI